MGGYTKLFGSIVTSTIWREPASTRLVWITMLALVNKDGVVEASVPGLAHVANVSLPDCETALMHLSQPDLYSRSKDQDGRRIEPVDGGWHLVNHAKYRDKLSVDDRREYNTRKQAERRQRLSTSVNTSQHPSTPVTECSGASAPSTHTSSSPSSSSTSSSKTNTREREPQKARPPSLGRVLEHFEQTWAMTYGAQMALKVTKAQSQLLMAEIELRGEANVCRAITKFLACNHDTKVLETKHNINFFLADVAGWLADPLPAETMTEAWNREHGPTP
jgi:hypothetical protein